jgi:hypothetical protein
MVDLLEACPVGKAHQLEPSDEVSGQRAEGGLLDAALYDSCIRTKDRHGGLLIFL